MAGPAAPHEKRVAEAVEVFQNLAVHRRSGRESHADTFGPAANGPANMEFGVEAGAAGQHERSQPRETFVHAVDFALQSFALGLCDACLPGMDVFREGGENGAEIE